MEPGRWNPEESTRDDVFRSVLYCLQRLASDSEVQRSNRNGIAIVVDLLHMRLFQVWQVTPSYMKKAADIVTVIF